MQFIKEFGENRVLYTPTIQIRNSSIVLYDLPETRPPQKVHELKGIKTYTGEVKTHTQKRIKCAIDIMLQLTEDRKIYNPISKTYHDFRVNFTTLTVASGVNITAREAYDNLLSKYLRYFKRTVGLKRYIWKAELQERGQIHYHILGDEFIDYRVINWYWNKVQKEGGYLKEYAKKYGHYKPNGTDIHKIHQVKNIEAYVAKYMCKREQNFTATKGKVWDCSSDLKRKRFSIELDEATWENIKCACEDGIAEELSLNHCTIIRMDSPQSLLSQAVLKKYRSWK